MPTITLKCETCSKTYTVPIRDNQPVICPECAAEWGKGKGENIFETCITCGCRHFYRHKDFNRALGCVIMLIGILLVPATYGLSLPVLALFDWWLHKKTPDVVVCYRCGAEYRSTPIPAHIHTFEHHLGEKYQEKE